MVTLLTSVIRCFVSLSGTSFSDGKGTLAGYSDIQGAKHSYVQSDNSSYT